jgi:hypothetical protein
MLGCAAQYAPTQGAAINDPLIGRTVKIAPANSADFEGPNVEEYGIESIRVIPSYGTKFGQICTSDFCVTGPSATTDFQQTTKANKAHDIAVVRLDRPVQGIAPDKAIASLGSVNTPAVGAYDLSLGELINVQAVTAGTSTTTADPTGRVRAFGTFEIEQLESPIALGPFIAVTSPAHCEHFLPALEPALVDYDAPGGFLHYDPATQGAACAVPNDSGGPTFVNAPALGGDSIASLPTGRLVAGLHSGGTQSPTACGTFSLDVTTWNLLYTLEGQTVVGQNGDFIRRSLTDFDRDLIPDDYDNCPNVANFGQANCNAIAEDAMGYERRGDACDPRPCAHGRIEPAEKLVSSWSGGSLILEQHGVMIRRDFEIDPRPSMPYYNGANDGEDGAGIAPSNVPTKYRFCQNDLDKLVNCESPSTVDNGLVDLPDGVIGPQRPFLRMAVWDPADPAPAEDNETLPYDGASQAVRRWDYQAHKAHWSSQVPPWISPVGSTGLFGTTTGLSGRLWVHSSTNIGLFATGSATGYRVSMAGTAVGDAELGNYYVPYAPDSPYFIYDVGAWSPIDYFEWVIPWDPWDALDAKWDGVMQEAATVIQGYEGRFARIQRDGAAVVVDAELGTGLKSLMAQSVLWGPAAEASLWQAHKGAHDSPHAVAFKSDGTDVFDGVWLDGVRGNAADVGQPSLGRSGGPSARTGFAPVYSRADDLAFVVGGVASGVTTKEIWYRSVETTDVPWTRIDLGGGYAPEHVKAATWSPLEQKLWVLDLAGTVARLARVHPSTGHAEILHSWTWTGNYDRHWMRLALDGSVMLFGSSSSLNRHGAAVFDAAPMTVWAEVSLARYQAPASGSGKLLYRPNVDPRGMTFVATPNGRLEVIRRDGLSGSADALSALSGIL